MPIPTDEQLEKWRQRWEKYPDLAQQIADILVGDEPAENDEEAATRMWKVNETLDPDDFEKYTGEGKTIPFRKGRFPVLDLRGFSLPGASLNKVWLPFVRLEGANLREAHLEGADLSYTHLEGADLAYAHLEGADLRTGHLEGSNLLMAHLEGIYLAYARLEGANLREAHLEGADLQEAHLEGAYLFCARLEGANLREAHLEGATLAWTYVGILKAFSQYCLLDMSRRKKLLIREPHTVFADTEFLPRFIDLLKGFKWREILKLLSDRWFYTGFRGVRIEDANTVEAADLRRYVQDQQFLDRFRERAPILYWFLATFCGWSAIQVASLSLLVIIFFAWVYASAPFTVPEWLASALPDFLFVDPSEKLIDPEAFSAKYPSLPEFWQWFFASFNVFTNLGIGNPHPQNIPGVIGIFMETVLGYIALVLLIPVMIFKFGRRA